MDAARGAELAVSLSGLRKALDTWLASGQLGGEPARAMAQAIDRASRIAVQGRLLAKIASGPMRHNNGQMRLDQILNKLLAARLGLLQQQGMELQRDIRPVTVIIDKDLTTALIGPALDWALEPDQRLAMALKSRTGQHMACCASRSARPRAHMVRPPGTTVKNLAGTW